MTEWIIALLLAVASFLSGGDVDQQAHIDHPECWEDEVVVQVVWDPYETSPGVGTFGCVAADNLPVTGNRP